MVQHDVHWQLPYWVIKPNQLMMVSTHTIISKNEIYKQYN
jgi:hypothetical protein